MPPSKLIDLCITRCARAQDGRGARQAERLCAAALAKTGDKRIAQQCAAAARRIGERLKAAA